MSYVLIVEPDHSLAITIARFLQKQNINVQTASEAQKAVIQADNKKPGAVILELAIPEHNGIEFLHELRSHSDWMEIPIVVYTHIPYEDTGITKAQWKKYGVHEYLYKSTAGLSEVAAAVRTCMAG